MQKQVFISKVVHMSFSMMIFNISQTLYSIYISQKTGAECVGALHLIMSVYAVALTLASAGIGLTVTRVISDLPGDAAKKQADGIILKCSKVCLAAAIFVGIILYAASGLISDKALKIRSSAYLLKLLAVCLPAESLSAVLCGGFTAFGFVGFLSLGRLAREASVWTATVFLMGRAASGRQYEIIIISECIASYVQCICDIFMYQGSRLGWHGRKTDVTYKKILSLCAPLAVGAYLRSGLASAENILVPRFLNVTSEISPIEKYGTIKGMSIPVMMTAYVFVGSFAAMLVPEIARRKSIGHTNSVRYISSISIKHILSFGFLISALLFTYHDRLCMLLYKNKNAGVYLGYLSALPVFMMTDTITDALLKGLDRQVASLKINIADSVMRVCLVVFLLPIFDIYGYIAILYISEILNLSVSFYLLKKETNLKFPFSAIVAPCFSAAAAYACVNSFGSGAIAASVSLFIAVYVTVLCTIRKIFY